MLKIDDNVELNEVLHDLRAPLVNVDGFAGELDKAVIELSDLIGQFDTRLPVEFHNRLATLIEQDVGPCLSLLQSAVDKLDKQIDRFALLVSVSEAGAPQGGD